LYTGRARPNPIKRATVSPILGIWRNSKDSDSLLTRIGHPLGSVRMHKPISGIGFSCCEARNSGMLRLEDYVKALGGNEVRFSQACSPQSAVRKR
jgi:hypothetical protein